MPIRSAFAAAALSAALLVSAGSACAGGAPPARHQNGHEQMSLERAVQEVQQQTKGRILAADSIPNGRSKLYRIKVLTPDGHVRVVQLRSNDGVLGKERKDNRSDSGGR